MSLAAAVDPLAAAQSARLGGCDLRFGITLEEAKNTCSNYYFDLQEATQTRSRAIVWTNRPAQERYHQLWQQAKEWAENDRQAFLEQSGVLKEVRSSKILGSAYFSSGHLYAVDSTVISFSSSLADRSPEAIEREAFNFVETILGTLEQRLKGGAATAEIKLSRNRDGNTERLTLDIFVDPDYQLTLGLMKFMSVTNFVSLSETFYAAAQSPASKQP